MVKLKSAQIVIGAVVGVYVLFFVVTSPDDAAEITHTVWQMVVNTAHGISTYISKL